MEFFSQSTLPAFQPLEDSLLELPVPDLADPSGDAVVLAGGRVHLRGQAQVIFVGQRHLLFILLTNRNYTSRLHRTTAR